MSTPKSDIFDKFTMLVSDNIYFNLSDHIKNMMFDSYLTKGAFIHFKKCRKNLNLETSPDYLIESFNASGTTYIISDYPTPYDNDTISLICQVNDVDVDYTFNKETLTFTLTVEPAIDTVIKCGYIYSGEYSEDLTQEEQLILATAMIISFVSYRTYDNNKMRDKIGSTDFTSPHSPATLLAELRGLKKDSENIQKEEISEQESAQNSIQNKTSKKKNKKGKGNRQR